MMRIRQDKFHNPLVEALEEPCFVFGETGGFLYHNAAGRQILTLIGYAGNRKPEEFGVFTGILRLSGGEDSSGRINIGDAAYAIKSSAFAGGVLLRLIPQHDSDHMVRLWQSLDIMPWALVIVKVQNEQADVVFCNERTRDFTGLPGRELTGKTCGEVMTLFGMADNILPFLVNGKPSRHDREIQKDGRMAWRRFHFIPYAGGQPYRLIVVSDTTDEKIMEGQYYQAQRLESLGKLAGGVAHDFNNILSIIDGYARIAGKAAADNQEAFSCLEHIRKAVQRGAALTGQLLRFGRHKTARDEVFDLGALVLDQEPLLRPLMDASVALSIRTESGVVIRAAPDDICQILLNLCVNARDAMPEGGRLTIECVKTKDGRAELKISDTGCGMTPEVRAKMFDPFFTTKERTKGTGLGLSTVYGLVRNMNGDIEVLSEPGQGTAMTVFLPLSGDIPEKIGESHVKTEKINLKGCTALVVEDDPDILDLVSGMMEEMGARVLRASHGDEALFIQNGHQGRIDFLLTDVVVPGPNGVRLAEEFTRARPDSQTIFMSGYPAKGEMSRIALPDNAYLVSKPVDFDKLCFAIRSSMGKRDKDFRHRLNPLGLQWRSA